MKANSYRSISCQIALQQENPLEGELTLSPLARIRLKEKGYPGNIYDPKRHHPLVIQTIQELKEKAYPDRKKITLHTVKVDYDFPRYRIVKHQGNELLFLSASHPLSTNNCYPDTPTAFTGSSQLPPSVDSDKAIECVIDTRDLQAAIVYAQTLESPRSTIDIITFNTHSTATCNTKINPDLFISSIKTFLAKRKRSTNLDFNNHPLTQAYQQFKTNFPNLDMNHLRYHPPFVQAVKNSLKNLGDVPLFSINTVSTNNLKSFSVIQIPHYPEYLTTTREKFNFLAHQAPQWLEKSFNFNPEEAADKTMITFLVIDPRVLHDGATQKRSFFHERASSNSSHTQKKPRKKGTTDASPSTESFSTTSAAHPSSIGFP